MGRTLISSLFHYSLFDLHVLSMTINKKYKAKVYEQKPLYKKTKKKHSLTILKIK